MTEWADRFKVEEILLFHQFKPILIKHEKVWREKEYYWQRYGHYCLKWRRLNGE